MAEGGLQLVERVLAGAPGAARALVDQVSPIIQARVAKALLRSGRGQGRTTRQEVEDFTQEVFASLFDDDGKALKAWKPERGLSLEGFVGFIAERQVASILRSGRRSPWTDEPTDSDDLVDLAPQASSPEPRVASKELLTAILLRLPLELSAQGQQLFELLLVEERPVDEVGRLTGLKPDAVYAWKSRLGKRIRTLAKALEAESETPISRGRSDSAVMAHTPRQGS